ncbi:MAG: HNH endonuclease [Acidiphilium sp. 37-67-22]|nr:MAG: HNH endonuclease [Acidiphilium sp. 37-67-22]
MPDGGQNFPALVLNADFRPLSYFPLSLWSWQDAVKAVFLDRVSVLHNRLPAPELTFDHVIPRARGGRTTWENVVTACGACNLRKGSKLPRECHMFPYETPRRPNSWELQDRGRAFPPNYLHESWRDFLYWDTELET